MMERIVYHDRSLLPTAVRRPTFEHEWIEYATSRPEAVKARLEGATVAITHRVFLSGEDLPPILRLIAVGATGAERIDLTACRARGFTSATSVAGATLFRSTFSPWRWRCGGTSLPTTPQFDRARGRRPPISH